MHLGKLSGVVDIGITFAASHYLIQGFLKTISILLSEVNVNSIHKTGNSHPYLFMTAYDNYTLLGFTFGEKTNFFSELAEHHIFFQLHSRFEIFTFVVDALCCCGWNVCLQDSIEVSLWTTEHEHYGGSSSGV